MNDPNALAADLVRGPRAELVLSVWAGHAETDKALRSLAVLAASPQIEGVVVTPGASLDLGGPLWPGAPFSAVLVAEPKDMPVDVPKEVPNDMSRDTGRGEPSRERRGVRRTGLVEDLELEPPMDPVRFFPLLPMTANEAAWKRARGAAALQERWLRMGTDLRDPFRGPVPLVG
jgi:hypothetical protein